MRGQWVTSLTASLKAFAFFPYMASAYPMLFDIDQKGQKCIDYNIPEEDEANFIIVVLPVEEKGDEEENVAIDHFVEQWEELTKEGGEKMPKQVTPVSPEIKSKMESLRKKGKRSKAGVIFMRDHNNEPIANAELSYYKPYVLHSIVETAKKQGYGSSPPLSGYRICFHNRSSKEPVSILFESVHWDDEDDDQIRQLRPKEVIMKHHLTPIDDQFEAALSHASQFLDEMKYAEKRSHRMHEWKKVAISRLRMYAYFSAVVLLGTAYTQVFYLKRYFKKKKLL